MDSAGAQGDSDLRQCIEVDIYTLDIVEVFEGLVEKYSLPPKLLEIEITETAYAEEYQIITEVVERLRSAGFTVLMDDFGSGYSSLNILKELDIDELKLDKAFLPIQESRKRGTLS